jgi:hypothetical protein
MFNTNEHVLSTHFLSFIKVFKVKLSSFFFFFALKVPAVDLDFRELEHIFPHLHRQLFKPLEPHLDFDLSSPGTSQEDSDFYQVY